LGENSLWIIGGSEGSSIVAEDIEKETEVLKLIGKLMKVGD